MELILTLIDFSNNLERIGKKAEASAATECAARLSSSLPALSLATPTISLSRSLSNLKNNLEKIGRKTEANAISEMNIMICKQLEINTPGKFDGDPTLSTGLVNNLSLISGPRKGSFRHVSHMGFDSEKWLVSDNVDPSWLALEENMDFIKGFVHNAEPEPAAKPAEKDLPPPPPVPREEVKANAVSGMNVAICKRLEANTDEDAALSTGLVNNLSLISGPKEGSFRHISHMGYGAERWSIPGSIGPSWLALKEQLERRGNDRSLFVENIDSSKGFVRDAQTGSAVEPAKKDPHALAPASEKKSHALPRHGAHGQLDSVASVTKPVGQATQGSGPHPRHLDLDPFRL